MTTLHDHTDDLLAYIESKVDPATGELAEDALTGIPERYQSFADKCIACIKVAQRYELDASGHEGRKRYLQSLADQERAHEKALANRAARLKEYVKGEMQRLGMTELEQSEYRYFRLRESGVAPVIIDDERELPQGYVTLTPNRAAIQAALKNGEEIPGARWGEKKVRLEVK